MSHYVGVELSPCQRRRGYVCWVLQDSFGRPSPEGPAVIRHPNPSAIHSRGELQITLPDQTRSYGTYFPHHMWAGSCTSKATNWSNSFHIHIAVIIHLHYMLIMMFVINTLRPRQDGRHYPDDISKCIFFNENTWILIRSSLKFVPNGPINKIPALVQIMAWHRSGDKSLSERMMVSLLTHICVTRPQLVKLATQNNVKLFYPIDFEQICCTISNASKKNIQLVKIL